MTTPSASGVRTGNRIASRTIAIVLAVVLGWVVRGTTPSKRVPAPDTPPAAEAGPRYLSDGDMYMRVAQHVGVFTGLPHGYRILVPYMAAAVSALTSVSLTTAFSAVAFVGFVLVTGLIIVWTHEGLGHQLLTACLLGVLFAFSYAGGYYLQATQSVSFYEYLSVLLGFMAIYHRRFGWLLAIVFVGLFVNERPLFLLPLYPIVAYRDRAAHVIWRTCALAVVCATALYILRSGILFGNSIEHAQYSSFYDWDLILRSYRYKMGMTGIIIGMLVTFPVLWPLSLLGMLVSEPRERLLSLLVPLMAVQIVIASDTLRMTALAVPALLMLVGNLFRTMRPAHQVMATAASAMSYYVFVYDERRLILLLVLIGAYLGALAYYLFLLRPRMRSSPAHA